MNKRTHRVSNRLEERAERCIPGGVNSNVRLGGPRLFFERARGAWLWDVDGNDYVDYLLGQGPAFIGHAPESVLATVEDACRKGMVFAAQNSLEVHAAERLCGVLGWPEMVRFGSSGSEVVHAALRLARAVTDRALVVRFEGHYHGWLDNILVSMTSGRGTASAGQLSQHLEGTLTVPWNNLDAVREVFTQRGADIAAIITEPVMCNAGVIQPREGYLAGLRDICDEYGTVLIFDEIVTGFRVGLGGAAERFGVTPDLATYGKAMAGGWPVAALAGGGALMERFGTGEVNHSGTFNANVMACAAIIGCLDALRDGDPHAQVEAHGKALIDGLHKLASDASLPMRISGLPMVFHASFGDPDVEISAFHDLERLDLERYRRFSHLLAEHGVWVAGRGVWFVSTAHGDRELAAVLERVESAMAEEL